ncbi:hypothetical protein B0H17DRAFT_1213998 [Mycena rosella]|uniref:Uncharacterized protein n=1 Tax=Mycena rosella TaxID=1033263 RepID=A0AAD7G4J2_MYCRO|nr:hypothetical protein B0H17DRAFT_1213998 [Mycena rosella]
MFNGESAATGVGGHSVRVLHTAITRIVRSPNTCGGGAYIIHYRYISARFSTSYRPTNGADLITKTLPPPPFSSTAEPTTRSALTAWWAEFRARTPVSEEDVRQGRFCVVVVGNKCDLLDGEGTEGGGDEHGARRVVRAAARPARGDAAHLARCAAPSLMLSDDDEDSDGADADDLASSELTARPAPAPASPPLPAPLPISILRSHSCSKSRPPSKTRRSQYASTVTSTLTVYHTPPSSVFSESGGASECFHSAQSSYDPAYAHAGGSAGSGSVGASARSASEATIMSAHLSSASLSLSPPASPSPSSLPNSTSPRAATPACSTPPPRGIKHFPVGAGAVGALASLSSSLLFPLLLRPLRLLPTGPPLRSPVAMQEMTMETQTTPPHTNTSSNPTSPPPLAPPSGLPTHFRTSARTGAGVGDVFAWVARRLVASHLAAEEEEGRGVGYGGVPRVPLVWGATNGQNEAEARPRGKAGKEGYSGCC